MRGRRLLALSAAMLLSSGACGGDSGGRASDGSASGSVSLLAFGAPEELQAFRSLITAYRDVKPDVSVNFIEASDRQDLLARLSTSFAGGTPPDLFLLNYRFYAQFAAKGVLEVIEARVDASEKFEQRDFYPQALDAFRFGGTLTCMPQNISSLVVYFNRSMFAAAGVDEPKPGWTWNEMVNAAKMLTRDVNGDGKADQRGLGVDPEIIRVAPFIWSNGGSLVDSETKPTTFTLDRPESAAALQQFFDLHRVHHVVPGDEEIEAENNDSRFENGRLGMLMSSRRTTPVFRKITAFDWDIAELPKVQLPVSVLHSDAYCMAKASDNKDAAWDFMEFALGVDGQRITAATGRTVPSLIELSTSPAFLDPKAKPANSKVFLDTIPVIRRLPNISTWPEIEDATNQLIEVGLYGTQPASAVASEIVEKTKPMFARGRS